MTSSFLCSSSFNLMKSLAATAASVRIIHPFICSKQLNNDIVKNTRRSRLILYKHKSLKIDSCFRKVKPENGYLSLCLRTHIGLLISIVYLLRYCISSGTEITSRIIGIILLLAQLSVIPLVVDIDIYCIGMGISLSNISLGRL